MSCGPNKLVSRSFSASLRSLESNGIHIHDNRFQNDAFKSRVAKLTETAV